MTSNSPAKRLLYVVVLLLVTYGFAGGVILLLNWLLPWD